MEQLKKPAAKTQDEQLILFSKHKKLIKTCMEILPSDYSVFQISRPTLLYFMLSSLDLLDQLGNVVTKQLTAEIIDWIYSLQMRRYSLNSDFKCGGFRGALIIDSSSNNDTLFHYDCAHLAQTYTSLSSLLILGDNFSRVDRAAILAGVGASQCEDGSFSATADRKSENDMRFVFCAAAICYMLDDFSVIDQDRLGTFIQNSVCYDGGIGQGPGLESHGGSTFCAIASLALMGRLWDESVLDKKQIELLKKWAVMKQQRGFHGRTNKPDDSCYAFWIGATLTLLDAQSFVNWPMLRAFLIQMQDNVIGGFCKFDESSHSDILHTYFSLAAFGMFGEPLIRPIFPALNISARAHEHLQRLKRVNKKREE